MMCILLARVYIAQHLRGMVGLYTILATGALSYGREGYRYRETVHYCEARYAMEATVSQDRTRRHLLHGPRGRKRMSVCKSMETTP